MKAPAEILQGWLIAEGLGIASTLSIPAPNWQTYYGNQPEKPDAVIVCNDTQGRLDGRIGKTGETVTHPGFQILVRATTHALGYAKAYAIALALDAIRNAQVVIGGETNFIRTATRTGDVLPLGVDDNRRHSFSINGTLTIGRA